MKYSRESLKDFIDRINSQGKCDEKDSYNSCARCLVRELCNVKDKS